MTETDQTASTPPSDQPLPPFYRKPVLLDSRRHSTFSMKAGGYGFAKDTISVFLNAVEFGMASKFYPVVFAEGERPTPVAILGLRQGRNLFVGGDGNWMPFTYIPAYVRRYPFILAGSRDAEKLGLCVDEDSGWLVEGTERPLFTDGKRTEIVEEALKLCTAFHRETLATEAFCKALKEHDLLTPTRADVSMASGEKSSLSGFLVVDQERFAALPDEVFLDWRKRGWLPVIYAHMLSGANWQVLVNRAAAADAH